MDKVADCSSVVITNATTPATKETLCSGVTTNAGVKCRLKSD